MHQPGQLLIEILSQSMCERGNACLLACSTRQWTLMTSSLSFISLPLCLHCKMRLLNFAKKDLFTVPYSHFWFLQKWAFTSCHRFCATTQFLCCDSQLVIHRLCFAFSSLVHSTFLMLCQLAMPFSFSTQTLSSACSNCISSQPVFSFLAAASIDRPGFISWTWCNPGFHQSVESTHLQCLFRKTSHQSRHTEGFLDSWSWWNLEFG